MNAQVAEQMSGQVYISSSACCFALPETKLGLVEERSLVWSELISQKIVSQTIAPKNKTQERNQC